MAANVVNIAVYSAQNTTGPDAFTTRFGSGLQTGAGVGFGGAAALVADLCSFLRDTAKGPLPVSQTQASPFPAQITVMDGITVATQTYTFTGNGTAADTVTINGQALTAVASGAAANQWNVGTSTATAAANLAACINASTTAAAVSQTVEAFISPTNSSVVVVACLFGGPIGNLITTAKTSTSITVGGATLTGGAANLPLTLGH